jgi:DNA-binding MarR family transcriptional regulator
MNPETSTHNGPPAPAAGGSEDPERDRHHKFPGPVTELFRAANQLRQHLDHTVLHPVALNWTSFDLLQLAVASGEVDSRTAAATLGVSKATITQVVRALSRRNLLRRGLAGDDQRRVLLRPTAVGWQLVHQTRAQIAAVENEVLHSDRETDLTETATTVLHAVAQRGTGLPSPPSQSHHPLSGKDHP